MTGTFAQHHVESLDLDATCVDCVQASFPGITDLEATWRPGWLLLLDALVCFGVLCVFLGTKHLGPFWDQRPGTQRMA